VEDPMYPDPSRPRLVARTDGIWTKVKLPSGRSLFYPSVAIGTTGEMTYIGQHQLTKKWCKLKNYAGKLAEQNTQAFSRDIMAHGMLQAEDAGYEIVLTVHDEILSEAPDTREYSTAGLSALMAKVPAWAPGIPLSAAGFEAYRYRK
jgi:DNA polymerase